MKIIFFAIFAFLAAPFLLCAQKTASNPLGGNLTVQDAGTCSTTGSFLWQQLPSNAATTTVNLAGTFSGTLTIRLSNNGGGSWTTNNTTTSAGTTSISTNGFTDICADVTTFTSGSFAVTITTGLNTGPQGPPGPGGGISTPGVFNSNFDPPLFQNYTLTTTGAQSAINLTANPIDTHTIAFVPSGIVTTCNIQLDISSDNVTWTAGGAVSTQDCSKAGQVTSATGLKTNYVRVNLTTLTGGGTITVVYSGRLAPTTSSTYSCLIGPVTFTATGRSVAFDNRGRQCISWAINYYCNGCTAISIELDQAPDNNGVPGTWTIFHSMQAMTGTQFGDQNTQVFAPWVSINLTVLGGGGATVVSRAIGFSQGTANTIFPFNAGPGTQGFDYAPVSVSGPSNFTVGDGTPQSQTALFTPQNNQPVNGMALGVLPLLFNGSTWDIPFYCKNTSVFSPASTGNTQIIAASGSTRVRICSVGFSATGGANNVKLQYGTGANCATGPADLLGLEVLGANGLSQHNYNPGALITPASQAVCANLSAATAVQVTVTWEQH
jgi:hypothetical protein